jgi:anaerobic magnesium-protoporphyrin IX monomethyl ester cyclase
MGYLAATLREGGHEPFIYDAAIEDVPVEFYIEQAEQQGKPYELIGITATTPLDRRRLGDGATSKKYGLTTVLGGPHLTIMPRESLEPRHAYVDYVFKGEAEHTFLELVDTIEAGRPVELLPGMHLRVEMARSSLTTPRP